MLILSLNTQPDILWYKINNYLVLVKVLEDVDEFLGDLQYFVLKKFLAVIPLLDE